MTKTPAPSAAVSAYLAEVANFRRRGNATEHTYRPALAKLLESFFPPPEWGIVNEPARRDCGAPDLAVEKNGVAVGFIETKDVGVNLDAEADSEQLKRYRGALPNLVLTDYVEFHHYADDKPVSVAKIADSAFRQNANGVDGLVKLFDEFAVLGESGRGDSPDAGCLAQIMAGKTRLLRALVEKVARDNPECELSKIHQELRENLIRGLTLPDFADIFAQTAAYGIFAARLEFEKLESRNGAFTRARAGELLPQTTPFLRRFFNAFAGPDMDARISWMADNIASMFAAVSLNEVARAFKTGGDQSDDPFLHFYETFLSEYDPRKRAARGVYFTPRPVVDFIVRAVDDSLKGDFAIRSGLADESMALCNGEEIPRVQILDPAAGTGAFLARIAELVRERVCRTGGEGAWPEYIRDHLLPRLNGFENMTSAYAMCHLKMALTIGEKAVAELTESVRRGGDRRVNVFLTDALQMPGEDMGRIGALHWLWEEARAANRVKTETPVMVVIGNPPYNVSTQNRNNKWINKKLEDYTKGLDEAHLNLGDDYVRFIRCAEHYIERNGRGIVAMITNNSFLDGVTHRQMRRHLLGTFDQIRILNLHGNARRRERAPDGGPDNNVFNIMQGVGIFIMAKTGEKAAGENARLFHAKLQGKRAIKYEFLARESVDSVEWRELRPVAPNYFFTPVDLSAEKEYMRGVGVRDLFQQNKSGVKTDRDSLFIDMDAKPLAARMRTLLGGRFDDEFAARHNVKDSSGYKMLAKVRAAQAAGFDAARILPMRYRPFDDRMVYYDPALLSRPNNDTMRHMKDGENVALLTTRLIPANHDFTHAHVSRLIAGGNAAGGAWTYVFPLWVWEGEVGNGPVRRANFRKEAASAFAKRMGMKYSEEDKGRKRGVVRPRDLFDYIYAVLHRPSYRRKFAEFLRIGFPRIPPAADESEFRRMAKLGGKLRALHLLEAPELDDAGFPFSAEGKNIVEKALFAPDKESDGATGRVVINKAGRHFAGVPRVVWDFCVGGYYPAQKWLKDRKGGKLSFADQKHYRRMLSALARTAELVGALDGE